MKRTLLIILSFALALTGCKYDDSSLWEEINAQKTKISALEGTVSTMNSNLGTLQSLVTSIQDKVTVNSVTKTEDGYLIAFSNGNTARINNGSDGKDGKDGLNGQDGKDGKDGLNGQDGQDGKDGKDGLTPQIGAKADSDGNYYWTLNGSWMLDSNGEKVSTSNTPKVKIDNDQWMVSYDNGANWTKVEGQGVSASVFKTVETTDTDAVFTLYDGTVITVPLTDAAQKLQLVFNESVFAKMRDGELLSTAYKIVAPAGATVDLETFESSGWTVTFHETDERTGRVSIKAPAKVTDSKILFLLTDDQGGSFVKIINIGLNESPKPAVQTEYGIDYKGGDITIPVVSSTAKINEDADWISIVSVGEEVVVSVDENKSYDYRTATVTLEDGSVISITQTTEDAIVLSKEVINIDGRRQLVAFVVNSNIVVKATVKEGSDWLSVSPTTRALSEKIFTFTAKRNSTEDTRTAIVEFSGHDITKTCTVNQAVFEGDPTIDVTEAAASDEGEELELKTSLIVAVTEDGYVVSDGKSYLFTEGSRPTGCTQGDSVAFKANATKFNGLPALGSVSDFNVVSGKHAVRISGSDITSSVSTFSSGVPTAVRITGDLTVDNSGNYNLTVKGATKPVLIYKPTETGLGNFSGYNVTITGIYYGESNGAINIIAVDYSTNGVTIKEGDEVAVAQFISLANTDLKLKLTGTVSNYNKSNCRFDLTDATGSIYVYTVNNKSEWSSKISNGGTVTLLGKYQYYEKSSQHEVVDADIISFEAASSGGDDKAYQYKKVTSVTSGKSYLIAALDGSKAYVGKPITGNYGYIYVDEATDENGYITMPSKDNEYVITGTNGQYTIAQSDGKLLYQTGTYTSFNVAASPESGQNWSISIASDGTATITNTSVNKYVQYSVSHNSFGSYPSAQSGALMPSLYEYVGEVDVEPGGGSEVVGNVETLDFSAQGFEDTKKYASVDGTYMTVKFGDGGNDGKYYNNGTAIRIYGSTKGYVQIESSKTITKIVYTFEASANAPAAGKFSVNTGSLTPGATSTWTGSAKSVKLTNGTGTGHWRLQKVEVTYAE